MLNPRSLFWLSGVVAVMAAIAAIGLFTRNAGPLPEPEAAIAASDTTALVLVTTSTGGELSECG